MYATPALLGSLVCVWLHRSGTEAWVQEPRAASTGILSGSETQIPLALARFMYVAAMPKNFP